MYEKFLKFLGDEGVTNQFLRNFYEDNYVPFCGEEMLDRETITSAFLWDNTKEGFHFWEEISNNWKKLLKE